MTEQRPTSAHARLVILHAFLALYALTLVPAVCVAGLLEHDCSCGAESCEHEEGCAEDPCNTVQALRENGAGSLPLAEVERLASPGDGDLTLPFGSCLLSDLQDHSARPPDDPDRDRSRSSIPDAPLALRL